MSLLDRIRRINSENREESSLRETVANSSDYRRSLFDTESRNERISRGDLTKEERQAERATSAYDLALKMLQDDEDYNNSLEGRAGIGANEHSWKSTMQSIYANKMLKDSKGTIDSKLGAGATDMLRTAVNGTAIEANKNAYVQNRKSEINKLRRQFKSDDEFNDYLEGIAIGWTNGQYDPERAEFRKQRRDRQESKVNDITAELESIDRAYYDPTYEGYIGNADSDQFAALEARRNELMDERERLEADINKYDRFQAPLDRYSSGTSTFYAQAEEYKRTHPNDPVTQYLSGQNESNAVHRGSGTFNDPMIAGKSGKQRVFEGGLGLDTENRTVGNVQSHPEWNELTEEELNIYYGLAATKGEESARRWLDSMSNVLGMRRSGEYRENLKDTNTLEKILLGAAQTPQRIASRSLAGTETLLNAFSGKGVNPYTGANLTMKESEATIGAAAEGLDNDLKFNILGQTPGKIYQGIVSGIDSFAQMMIGQVFGSAHLGEIGMALGAGAAEAAELWEKGIGNDTVLARSILAGTFEALFEHMSIEAFMKNFLESPITGWADLVKKTGVQVFTEGSEEVFTDGANFISDLIHLRSQSEWAEMFQRKKAQGLTDGQAIVQSLLEEGSNLVDSFMGGVYGALLSSGGGAMAQSWQSRNTGSQIISEGAAETLRKTAEELAGAEGLGEQYAQALNETTERVGKKATPSRVGYMYNAVENAINEGFGDNAEAAVKAGTKVLKSLEKSTDIRTAETSDGQTVTINEDNPIARFENGKAILNTSNGEMSVDDLSFADDSARLAYDNVNTYDVETANAVLNNYQNGGIARYLAGMREGIELHGKMNVPSEAVSYYSTLSEENQRYARTLGQTMRQTIVNKAVQAAKTGTIEQFEARDGETLAKTFSRKGAFGTNGATYTYGTVDFSTKEAKQARATANRVADITGNAIITYDSRNLQNDDTKLGRELKNADGKYVYRNGAIYVDIAAGPQKAQGLVAYALAHELTHSMEQWAREEYDAYADWLIKNYSESGASMEDLVKEKMAREGKDYEDAYHEVVADASSRMLIDTDVLEKLESLREKDPNVFKRVVAQIRKFVESLSKIYDERFKGVQPTESALTENFSDEGLKKLRELWVEGAVKTAERRSAAAERSRSESKTESKTEEAKREADGNKEQTQTKAVPDGFGEYINSITSKNPTKAGYKLANFFRINEEGKVVSTKGRVYTIHNSQTLNEVYENIPWIPDGARVGVGIVRSLSDYLVYDLYSGEKIGNALGFGIEDAEFAVSEWAKETGKAPSGFLNLLEEKTATFQDAISKAINNRKSRETPQVVERSQKTPQAVSDMGINIDKETESANPDAFSLKTWEESDYVQNLEVAAKELAEELGVSLKDARKYIRDVNSIAKIIAADRTRLDFDAAPGLSAFISNVEYGGSIDFSTICKKRRLMTGTMGAIQEAIGNTPLSIADFLNIRNMMKAKGYEVSCGLCYVEGSRAQMGKFAAQFRELYQKYNPDAEWIPTQSDLVTPDKVEKMRTEHPDVYEEYEHFWNNHGKLREGDPNLFASQQKPKLFQADTEYNGEILNSFRDKNGKVDKEAVKAKNRNGGLRIQSFSDFEIIHLLDCMQVITDMSRVGLAGQAYTKVADFARALGPTGLKINLSLIAKGVDENGNIILDEVEGMKRSDAEDLRNKYSDNVGTILVVFSDAQLKAALNDPFIDFIIPFHRSQWASKYYDAMGLPGKVKDFTSKQNEKLLRKTYHEFRGRLVADKARNFMPNEYWEFDKDGKYNAEKYLRMCAEQNKKPKFDNLLVNNGDGSYSLQPDGSTDGYWKLLIDFKMYNNEGKGAEQMPVKPQFDIKESNRMLDEYEGGHQTYPVAQDIVDEFLKSRNSDKSKSYVSSEDSARYLELAKDPKANEAELQRMVEEAARSAGYDSPKLYHGTSSRFTVFDRKYLGDATVARTAGVGFFFTNDKGLADKFQRYTKDFFKFAFGIPEKTANTMQVYLKIEKPYVYETTDGVDPFGNFSNDLLEFAKEYTSRWAEPIIDDKSYLDMPIGIKKEIATAFARRMKRNGYDGIVIRDTTMDDKTPHDYYVVFNSEQVKSADPVTYDDNGNVIPLEERFNPENEDIRRSDKNKEYVSDRELLANALQNAARDSIEYEYLEKYKENVEKLDGMQARLDEINGEIRSMTFGKEKGKPLTEGEKMKLRRLHDEATKLRNRITTIDKRLVKISAAEPIRNVLKNERMNSYRKGREKGKEIVRIQNKRRELRTRIKALHKNMSTRLLNPKENKYVPADLRKAVAEVLEAIDTDSGRSESLTAKLDLMNARYKAIAQEERYHTAYDPYISKMITELSEAIATAEADNAARGKRAGIYGMTSEHLEMLYTAMKAFDHAVRDDLKKHALGSALDENLTTHDVGEKLIEETRQTADRSKWMNKLFAGHQLRPSEFFERLAGYKKDSYWMRVYRMLDNAQRRMKMIEMQSNGIFEDILKDEKYLKELVDTKNLVDLQLPGDVKITRGMMLSLYKHLLNEDNARHVAVGGLTVPGIKEYYNQDDEAFESKSQQVPGFVGKELTEAYKAIEKELEPLEDAWERAAVDNDFEALDEIDKQRQALWSRRDAIIEKGMAMAEDLRRKIEGMLTDKDREFLAAADEYFDNYSKTVLNEATMAMYGFEKARVEGYFPIHTDSSFRQVKWDQLEGNFTLEGAGFMKDRMKGAVNPILLEDFSTVINQQINKVARYAGLAPALKEFSKLYGVVEGGNEFTTSVQKMIGSKFGAYGKKYISNLIEDLNGSSKKEPTFLDKARSFAAGAVLTANIRVSLAQAASYTTAISELGHKAVVKALGEGIKRAPNDIINKYTALLWERKKGYTDVAMGDVRTMNKLFNRVNSKAKWLTGWIQAVDTATVGRLWYACEYWVQDNTDLEKGTDAYYMQVAEKFGDVIEKTQPSYSALQRPDVLRSRSQFTRALTMFMTQRLQNQNIVYGAVRRYHKYRQDYKAGINGVTEEDLKSARNEAVRSVASQIYSAALISGMKLFADVLLRNMGRRRDDEEEVTAQSLLLSSLSDMLSSLASNYLGGSELYDVISALMTGDKWYGISVGGIDALEGTLESFYKNLNSLVKGDGVNFKDLKGLLTDASNLVGLPVSNVYKLLNGVRKTIDDAAHGNFFSFKADGELLDWGKTVERTSKQKGNILLESALNGDDERYAEVYGEFKDSKSKTAGENADAALLEATKDAWISEEISDEDAKTILKDKLGCDEKTIAATLDKWQRKKNGEDIQGFSPYDTLKEAMRDYVDRPEGYNAAGGTEIKKTIQEYRDLGYTDQQIQKAITNEFKDEYVNAGTSRRVEMKHFIVTLFVLCGKKESDAKKQVDGWLK